jgi:SNF family Na+-dependent transporter
VDELAISAEPAFNLWYTVIRYVSPVAVVLVFLKAIGVI